MMMSGRLHDVRQLLLNQRQAILRGDYVAACEIGAIECLLPDLSLEDLDDVSGLLRRNLELLAIARDSVASSSILSRDVIYAADGGTVPIGAQPRFDQKR
ncbi:hypothetical protein [Roseobacter sp. HKCCA0434]|uniref:hypothetical protein n=1 Tax=Roseobacter sp. HKCCA0434 TaxID=3079297 RepID=UPI002905E22B|nr:hypothetical protein [Roseobacter sp. HKCCA0434]